MDIKQKLTKLILEISMRTEDYKDIIVDKLERKNTDGIADLLVKIRTLKGVVDEMRNLLNEETQGEL